MIRVKLSKSCLGHVGFKCWWCLRTTCVYSQLHMTVHVVSKCQDAGGHMLVLRVYVQPHLCFS